MDAAGSDSRSGNHLQGTQPPNGQGLPPAGSGGDKCAESRKRRRERQIFCMWSKGSMFPKAMALPKPSECPLRAAPQCPRYLARRAGGGGGGTEQPRGWECPRSPIYGLTTRSCDPRGLEAPGAPRHGHSSLLPPNPSRWMSPKPSPFVPIILPPHAPRLKQRCSPPRKIPFPARTHTDDCDFAPLRSAQLRSRRWLIPRP